ncbi:MAG: hypothetical protein L0Z62_48870 [Gemmataceae bacterium]|nr:hypothetical protein [Gemmataceae bacterium]
MLIVNVGEGGRGSNDALVSRFERLVNRLLPFLWRFRVDPKPHWAEMWFDPGRILGPQAHPVFIEGVAHLDLPPAGQPQTRQTPEWKVRFQEYLQSIIALQQRVEIRLVDADERVLFGNFQGDCANPFDRFPRAGAIDVADFEAVPDQVAAQLLVHELVEQSERQLQQLDFRASHTAAMVAESAVRGAVRLEHLEYTTPGVVASRNYWIPYQRADGRIHVIMLRLRQNNIAGRREAIFANEAAYTAAAQSAGLALVFPPGTPLPNPPAQCP